MIDCSAEMGNFHADEVRLPEPERAEMRDRRAANQKRLKSGLASKDKPAPKRFVKQGSYAMHTMVQHPEKDYDIDDGAVFAKTDLVGPRGGDMAAVDAREMVREALDDGSFKTPPVTKTNCVRVLYDAGYHVDVPVYREFEDAAGKTCIELAGAEWRRSDPTELNTWFNQAVIDKSPDAVEGRQMRRIVCLLKAFARSRKTWNLPSGLIQSVLADEQYIKRDGRDDEALYDAMKAIHTRLLVTLQVYNPVDRTEELTKGGDDPKARELRDRLKWAVDRLLPVKAGTCTKNEALKRWNEVFGTNYFGKYLTDEKPDSSAQKIAKAVAVAAPTAPRSWSR